MSIKPISDIVLDVARAADPARSSAAAERLARLGSSERASDGGFLATLEATNMPGATTAAQFELRNQVARMGVNSAGIIAPVDAGTKAYKGLEQLVLQRLVETMLPTEAGELFGHGAAGDIWRSMLAEQLATQIGKSVDLGLAKSMPGEPGLIASAETLSGGRAITLDALDVERRA